MASPSATVQGNDLVKGIIGIVVVIGFFVIVVIVNIIVSINCVVVVSPGVDYRQMYRNVKA